ncbi:hypothetical protein [cyanobacterium endosymbiont of Epithemia turgida]|nr:hypothetical protein [cyanobacterium endosymbiont of Epithemia turgida]BAP17673.1 hypothetical protein ETSB_0867 [cyanobacterium endosymbiont of Epithemia turgida isolate EtSB Lake Yunoko]
MALRLFAARDYVDVTTKDLVHQTKVTEDVEKVILEKKEVINHGKPAASS